MINASTIFLGLLVSGLLGWLFSLPWLSRLFEFLFEGSKEVGNEKVNEAEIKQRKIKPRAKKVWMFGLSRIELAIGLIAAVLFGTAVFLTENLADNLQLTLVNILLFIVIAGVSLLLHELAHIYVADRYNVKTEYRFWTLGTMIMFITTLLPPHTLFSQPSRTIVDEEGEKDKRKNGIMAIAGPIVSLLLFIVFLIVYMLNNDIAVIKTVAYSGMLMNIVLCVYGLMPFKPMDGPEVREWNKGVWAAFFFIPMIFYIALIIFVL